MSNVRFTAVIPAYNEVESIPSLFESLKSQLDALVNEGEQWEVLFVDDGSNDGTTDIFRDLHAQHPDHVRLVRFRVNQGKSAALAAAFQRARGQIVLTLDADGQDDPREIPKLLEKLEDGCDVVVGWKKERQDPAFKVFASGIFNGMVARATGLRLHDINCGLKAMRQVVAKELPLYGELHRFMLPIAHMKGFRCGEVAVVHHPRRFGQSKFGARRYAEGVFDLITILFLSHFQVRPMHLFGGLGSILFGLGFLISLYLSLGWFQGIPIAGRPLFFLGILALILGLQLFTTGLIAELVTRNASRDMEFPIDEELPPTQTPGKQRS